LYLGWYLLISSPSGGQLHGSLAALEGTPAAVVRGVSTSVGNLTGLGSTIGLVIAITGLVAVGWGRWRLHWDAAGALAGIASLATQFTLLSLSRPSWDIVLSRHQYVAVIFVLVIVVSIMHETRLDDRRAVIALGMVVLAAVSVTTNLSVLISQRDWYLARADGTRAWADLLTKYGGSPALPDRRIPGGPNRELGLLVAGSPGLLQDLFTAYGSPLDDAVWGTRPIPDASTDGVVFRLIRDQVVPVEEARMPEESVPTYVREVGDAELKLSDHCYSIGGTGPTPSVGLGVPGGSRLYIQTDAGGDARLFLSLEGTFAERFQLNYSMLDNWVALSPPPNKIISVPIPDIGNPDPWLLKIDLLQSGNARICIGPGRPESPAP
jgi:hypothetical protein